MHICYSPIIFVLHKKTQTMHLGDKIRAFRELKNYTQEYVANRLRISQQTYSYIEQKGIKEDDKRFEKIADVLGTSRENIQNFDSNKIFNQNNHDNAQGYFNLYCTFHQQGDELIKQLKLQNELMSKMLVKMEVRR